MLGNKWPEAWSKSIAIDHAAGLGTPQIAINLNAKFGCDLDARTVYKRLWRMGLTSEKKAVWTEERKARVVALHSENAGSYTQMALVLSAEFGESFSRNAVISIAKRLGLTGKPQASAALRYNPDGSVRAPRGRQPRKSRAKPKAPKVERPVRPSTEAIQLRCVELAPLHIQFFDLEPHHCRWPFGGEAEGSALSATYCGHPRGEGAGWYCTAHFHLSLKPPSARRTGFYPSNSWRAA